MVAIWRNMLIYIVIVDSLFVGNTFLQWMRNDENLQKDLWLFRALPYASVRVGQYLESELSDIPRHPHPRLPDGRLKATNTKKPPLAVKKVRLRRYKK